VRSLDRLVTRRIRRWLNTGLVILGLAGLGGLTLDLAAAEQPVKSPPSPNPKASFLIPAWAFDRGNAKTFTQEYADAGPMVAFGGESPIVVEYDVEFPVDGTWTIWIRYCAAEARPVVVSLDETGLGEGCRGTTGTWNTSSAAWEKTCQRWFAPGKHTLRLKREGAFPHVVSLRLDCTTTFPAGWKLNRPKARRIESPVTYLFSRDVSAPSPASLRLAIQDLIDTFGPRYPQGPEYLARLDALAVHSEKVSGTFSEIERSLAALAREALLANPLLDFDRLLLVQRGENGPALGLPYNWQSNSCLAKTGYDDRIAVLSPVRPEGKLATLFKPDGGRFVGDVDLHFEADRLLFSMPGSNNRWQVFEIRADGTGLRQLTGEQPDVDSYDACYLPSGKILFTSTACFVGVPCVYGSSHVAVLYVMDANGRNIRQLCFEQEHDWCPTVLNSGRILYTRWEYCDTPHSNTRLLFTMNPDGTGQMAYLGSNSYWPNSFFYARPIPNHPTKVVSVIGGHHDNPRMGELLIFDPALGRSEGEPAVQRIPGYKKKIEPIIRDGLTISSWPKFLHPYPLSDKYFLVACKPMPQARWGIYLVDVFDNFTLIKDLPGYALLEPIPFRKTPVPPVIPEKLALNQTEAVVYIPDIHAGDGLKGVPRGTVKSLRLVTYHFAYQGMGGLYGVVGVDGPWDIKRVLGTVPVNPDGSAKFRVPANTPISIQPLDDEGKALQLMRTWMTAMPGEVVQCSGCHEPQNSAPPRRDSLASSRPPARIQPWRGPLRGFSYQREVQPVIDRYCVACHNKGSGFGVQGSGRPAVAKSPSPDLGVLNPEPRTLNPGPRTPNPTTAFDLRGSVSITDYASVTPGNGGSHAGKFTVGYAELQRFVRRPGIESDFHMLEPMEFYADTTQLVEMLKKGHYNVKLDAEAWDRLITWIDLNCPFHGTWGEEIDHPGTQRQRRRDLLKLYANVDDDPEAVPKAAAPVRPLMPEPPPPVGPKSLACPGWPFDAAEAQRRQATWAGLFETGNRVSERRGHVTGRDHVSPRKIDLGKGVFLEMVLIPPGEFVMGSTTGAADERPLHRVRIQKPFWMATTEVTNQVYNLFDPKHDSRIEDKNAYQFGIHGYPMNRPEQPVVRVSWLEAMAFCRWLSARTGLKFDLPSEAEWEYACRAGTASPVYYGDLDTDFSKFANLADAKLSEFASDPFTIDTPLKNPTKYDDWLPKDARFNDGALLTIAPGRYLPNAWGLFDMHGNVAEWTRSTYRPYPFREESAAESAAVGRKVVRGGSWRDLPKQCTSSYRFDYLPFQRVYNVGIRVIAASDAIPVANKMAAGGTGR